jgi:ribosomal protein S18 acetylase RimI-like enzyme
MKATIRFANTQDYIPLLDLFELVDTLHRENLPGIFQKPTGPARDQDYFESLLLDQETGLFIAEVEDEIAGFILAILHETPPFSVFIPSRLALVSDIAVKTEFRRQGIGRLLVNKIHEWGETRGASAVELTVYAFNQAAIDFYETIGYETINFRMRYPIIHG